MPQNHWSDMSPYEYAMSGLETYHQQLAADAAEDAGVGGMFLHHDALAKDCPQAGPDCYTTDNPDTVTCPSCIEALDSPAYQDSVGHDPARCGVAACELCDAYGTGYARGKAAAHSEIRFVAHPDAGHTSDCGCEPCQTVRAVMAQAARWPV